MKRWGKGGAGKEIVVTGVLGVVEEKGDNAIKDVPHGRGQLI